MSSQAILSTERKIRRAQDFVPVITGTEVLEEKDNEVTRVAFFTSWAGRPASEVKEICRSFPPTKVSGFRGGNGDDEG